MTSSPPGISVFASRAIATILKVDADFSRGFVPATQSVGNAVSSLAADRADLQARLLDRERRLATAGATIHYTLDGTDPDRESPRYREPFTLSETTAIRMIGLRHSARKR